MEYSAASSDGPVAGFVLSLDFELMWGVLDSPHADAYAANILGVREAVPALLQLFEKHRIRATWASVGFLFFDSYDALVAALPDRWPTYPRSRMDAYDRLSRIGRDETADPMHYGRALLEQIAAAPGQEIGTHTFSHLFCLEQAFDPDVFDADIRAAVRAARTMGIELRSIVFPRNQIAAGAVEICLRHGIDVIRGCGPTWYDRALARQQESWSQRAARLARSYFPFDGSGPIEIGRWHGAIDVPASRFLRPAGRGGPLAIRRQIATIQADMRRAARSGRVFHLWFHPHNFGRNLSENLEMLEAIVIEAGRLDTRCGWPSLSMADAAELWEGNLARKSGPNSSRSAGSGRC